MNDSTAAIERVVSLAEGYRKAIEKETGILYTGENIQKISTLIQLKKGKIDAETILNMTDREILDSLIEDCKKAGKYIETKVKETPLPGKEIKHLKLIDLFEKTSQYHSIISILSDKKFINRTTNVWIDKKKAAKKTCAGILKELQNKGYFKKEYIEITSKEWVKIAENTFRFKVGGSTFAHTEASDNNFIPPCI